MEAGNFFLREKGSFSLETAVVMPVIILIISAFLILAAQITLSTYADSRKSLAEETDYIDETETDRILNTLFEFAGD